MTKPMPMSQGLMKRLTQLPHKPLSGYQAAARGGPGVRQTLDALSKSGIAGSGAGVVSLRQTYAYQSYFDSALNERALLPQAPSEPIVASTFAEEPTPGYGVGLYPASESPVAVQLLLGRGSGDKGKSGSSTFILRPGEIFQTEQRFEGVRYGLPFGWLGGGTIQLRIFPERNDRAIFVSAGAETLFHRVRLPIFSVADNPAAGSRGASPNWPISFPWINGISNVNSPQASQPSVVVDPRKLIIRLRKAALPNAARMRLLLVQTDDLDLGSDAKTYDAIGTSGSWFDFPWPAVVASGFQIGNNATAEFPLQTFDDQVTRIGGGNAIMILLDMDGTIGSSVGGGLVYCDIERYGLV